MYTDSWLENFVVSLVYTYNNILFCSTIYPLLTHTHTHTHMAHICLQTVLKSFTKVTRKSCCHINIICISIEPMLCYSYFCILQSLWNIYGDILFKIRKICVCVCQWKIHENITSRRINFYTLLWTCVIEIILHIF